jgi:urease accessory protein
MPVMAMISDVGALPLSVWLSPMFPVGSFAFSQGLEWAFESGDVASAADLADWLAALLAGGTPRNDALLLAEAYRAAAASDRPRLAEAAALALALATGAERRLETASQGRAFLVTARIAWPCPAFDWLPAGDVAYPVAIGAAAAGHGQRLVPTLELYLLGFISNLISAALKLGSIGQTDGQIILARLLPAIRALAAFAESGSLEDLGTCCFRADLAAIRHETQYTRLFRS